MITAKGETFDKVLGLELGRGRLCGQALRPQGDRRAHQGGHARTGKTAAEADVKEVSYDKLVVNMTKYELKVDGKVIDTPPKELELLYHLASNPNRVYTRDQLLDEVWGFEYYGDSQHGRRAHQAPARKAGGRFGPVDPQNRVGSRLQIRGQGITC